MAKPKIAFYGCASCGGCDEAVVDLAEELLDVAAAADIVLWPTAFDFKCPDVEALPDQSLAAAFINGAIRTREDEDWVRLLRRKSQRVVACGACAQYGGVPGLANQFSREHLMKRVFDEVPSLVNPMGTRPRPHDHGLDLPALHDGVRSLDQVVRVDYFVPGCAPPTPLLARAMRALLAGTLPPPPAVLAPDVALCDECPRKASKPAELSFASFKRPSLAEIDGELCLLAQGFLCMGPATRAACGAACIRCNMPCTGCGGATSRVRDQGAKMLSSLASSVAASDQPGIDAILQGIPDPVGTLYRYSLARSLLRRRFGVA